MTGSGPARIEPWDRLGARLVALSSDPVPPDQADAAVLVLARSHNRGLEVLAEQRAQQDGDPWSGQVSLPGGHKESGDRSLTETVLRELHEEVGLTADSVEGPPRIFGVRRARPSGVRVAVFVGRVAPAQDPSARADSTEVAGTFWFPLDRLQQIESRPRKTVFGEMPVDTVEHEGHIVWGFTLRVLREVAEWLDAPATSGGEAGPAPPARSQAL